MQFPFRSRLYGAATVIVVLSWTLLLWIVYHLYSTGQYSLVRNVRDNVPETLSASSTMYNLSNHSGSTIQLSLNFSQCPQNRPFQVYLYNYHYDMFSLWNSSLVDGLKEYLKNTKSWAEHPDSACVFVLLVGPTNTTGLSTQDIQQKIYSLQQWDDTGTNHVLIDLGGDTNVVNRIDTKAAVVASFMSSFETQNALLHILTPPVSEVLRGFDVIPSLFDVPRKYLLYFEGKPTTSMAVFIGSWQNSETLTREGMYIKFRCSGETIPGSLLGEWELCQEINHRLVQGSDSKFSLILGTPQGFGGFVTYLRLMEALRCGSVPVIVGLTRLPFDTVIAWNKATILLSTLPQQQEMRNLLSGIHPATILEYRRQGRFLLETYFNSKESIVRTVIALTRARLFHQPPTVPEYEARTLVVRKEKSDISPSPRILHYFTISTLDLWNIPPGPFYVYPTTPFTPPYIPAMHNQPTSSTKQVAFGPSLKEELFRSQLRGNYIPEGFTVVALTYHRSEGLPKFLNNFKGCPFLSKVVIVWNNEEDPSPDIQWPDIGVPVEVVILNRNSLNNRFLPFSNIETEAVLTVDDDQVIPFGQIELAFRVWRENRDRIVGWYDRTAEWDNNDPRWVYVWGSSCQTSMALTGAAMIHKYYMFLYTYWMPKAARDMVDREMNGEDFAMNFLISYISRKPPIKIDLESDLHQCIGCDKNSISSDKDHLDHRRICLNELVNIWGHSTLLRTQFRAEPLLGNNKCLLTERKHVRFH